MPELQVHGSFACFPPLLTASASAEPEKQGLQGRHAVISDMLSSLRAMWDSLKSVIKVLGMSKLKSPQGMRMRPNFRIN